MTSAITPNGELRFSTFTSTMTAEVFVAFCRRLLHDDADPVFLIVDGHPVHQSKAVMAFTDSTDGRLRLFFLPPYSPELNPDEWVWKNVKHDRIGKAGVPAAWTTSDRRLRTRYAAYPVQAQVQVQSTATAASVRSAFLRASACGARSEEFTARSGFMKNSSRNVGSESIRALI